MDWTLKQACFQGYPESTVYVQVSIGSRNSAIHNAYHSSLRPSSLFEPRHRSLKVVRKKQRRRTPPRKVRLQMQHTQVKGGRQELRGGDEHPPSHLPPLSLSLGALMRSPSPGKASRQEFTVVIVGCVRMILPQVHLRKPCYDFSFL